MATELTDGLWHVDCTTRDKPNVFLVDDGTLTLVDAGWPPDEDTVRKGFADAGYHLSDVDRILLTHYDADHVGTLSRLTPALDAELFVHVRDAPYVAGERLPPWTARNGIEALHRLYYSRLTLPDLPVNSVEDGNDIGGFTAVHTPGHTPGHLAYVHDGLGAVFTGDLAWELGGELRSSGRLTSYDRSQVGPSLERLVDHLEGIDHLCPGHGSPTAVEVSDLRVLCQ